VNNKKVSKKEPEQRSFVYINTTKKGALIINLVTLFIKRITTK
jgi:hypothetical protein